MRVANGAWLQSTTSGNNSRAGDITIRATDVDAVGYETLQAPTSTAIANLVLTGNNNQSGNITVDAQRVRLLNGSRIGGSVLGGNGQAGEIIVNASESLEIRGTRDTGTLPSGILSSMESGTTGQGGRILIDTGLLIVSQGGVITTELAGSQIGFFGPIPGAQGTAGSIDIRAREVQVSEPTIDGFSQGITGITASVGDGAVGAGGSINLTADRLRVFDGGQINTSSFGQGPAGSVNLQVQDIDVQGISPSQVNGQFLPSTITAAANSSFNAGSVNIRADRLRVRDGAKVTVSNSATGDAGNLTVWARNVFLDNGGSLQAEVNGGGQGNIRLHIDDLLVLRNGSNITTNAQGASTGGNISIDAGFVIAVADENSDIIANAIEGNGGNIDITTQGIFGLEFRDQLTPESDITASSQFGVSGTVQITTINTDPSSGVIELPEDVADPSQQIATGCAETQGSQFVATGRGGIPQNPTQQVNRDRTWEDVRDLSAYRQSENAESPAPTTVSNLIETTSWRRNANGQVELIAQQSAIQQSTFATCSSPAIRSGTS